jgi:hypothetical protein
MTLASELVERWRRDGVSLNAGATPEQFDQLARFVGCALPDEFLDLYSLCDGMFDRVHDSHLVYFWPISKILAEPRVDVHVPFADFLIDSWWFLLSSQHGQLRVLSQNVPRGEQPRVLGTFGEFLYIYLNHPGDLGVDTV